MLRRRDDREGLAVLAELYSIHGADAVFDVRVGDSRYLVPASEFKTSFEHYQRLKAESGDAAEEEWRGRALSLVVPAGEDR